MSLLRAALIYVDRGWATFPVAGKVPRTPRGFVDASTDPDVLERLFADPRATGIAIACGASRLLVVDLDGSDGRHSWADLRARHGGHDRTLTVETGKPGGLHLYFEGEGRSSAPARLEALEARAARKSCSSRAGCVR
ncbi:MAG: bifunctional DNA primase/polymerase [Actinomycetota bacterium]|nr:bifunctional DNA primase/polymerase [Actinomycetota bacterium]